MPMPSGAPAMPAPPPRTGAGSRLRRGPRLRTAACSGLRCGNALRLLDVDEYALLRVEEAVVDLRPAAELVDREQLRRDRELRLVLQRGKHGAVALGDEDLLGRRRPQVVAERLGRARVLRVAGHRGRVLDEDRLRRDDVADVLALLLGGDGLVLVRERHVAL